MMEDFDSSMEPPDKPIVVCLCGSTRFGDAFAKANLDETLAGRIVLTIGCNMKSDSELFGSMGKEELTRIKTSLDELHKRKIDLADEILVLNVGGYVGDSTRSEIEYAKSHGKNIRWLEPTQPPQPAPTLVKLVDPTSDDLKRNDFDRVWNAIKGWDIQRYDGAGYAGATGTDVMTILNALDGKSATQPAPVPKLVEVVEDIGKACEETNEPISKRLAGTIGLALLALAAEKRRQELICEILKSARSISKYDVHTHGICFPKLECEIQALDAFDKERGV